MDTVLYGLFGFLVGVFLNLCADQLPLWRRLHRVPFCPYCDESRPGWAWIGTLAYLRFKPGCQQCGAPISWRHPLTELATAGLYAFLWIWYGAQGEWIYLALYTVYSTIFVLVIVIDMEHRLIINEVMYPAWALALLASFVHPKPHFYRFALLGWLFGYGLLFLVYYGGEFFVKVMSKARGKDINEKAFGFGDVKLGGFIGLALGFPDVLTALFWGVLLGGVAGLLYWIVQAVILRRYSLFTPIPYGPFLAFGAMIVMFFY